MLAFLRLLGSAQHAHACFVNHSPVRPGRANAEHGEDLIAGEHQRQTAELDDGKSARDELTQRGRGMGGEGDVNGGEALLQRLLKLQGRPSEKSGKRERGEGSVEGWIASRAPLTVKRTEEYGRKTNVRFQRGFCRRTYR